MKKMTKRNLKLQRDSERELKLNIISTQTYSHDKNLLIKQPKPSFQIESCKRFMSLSCRTVPCIKQNIYNDSNEILENKCSEIIEECFQNRVDFYKTLNLLIKMGCNERQTQEKNPRRTISREEQLWQNEVKDLIWLELQAFHADRTIAEEDDYLCYARENVEPLLNDILTYKFERHCKRYSTQNSDSGVEDDCPGCLSMYCQPCVEAQNEALRDIEKLMKRLELIEDLFPSSKAIGEMYPLYNSSEFVGRVKAISLWYNMVKHQRLKLLILGKLLAFLDHKNYEWPLVIHEKSYTDSSPSESTNSSLSVNDYFNDSIYDFYNIVPLAVLANKKSDNSISPYRKYIENILKTRTLQNSLSFLGKLHTYVLKKANLTLQKPENNEIFQKSTCENEDEELQRYGCWSPEAVALGLPSYRAMFLFLTTIPLEVIHEFLQMRIEQKPENPSPLSIRQLMKELKDGLKVAVEQKKKFLNYIKSATDGTNETATFYKDKLNEYDLCTRKVFSDYLEYVEKWSLLYHDTFQKSLLEEEWEFSCGIIPFIPDSSQLLGEKFSFILCTILNSVGERLKHKMDEVFNNISLDNMSKQVLFTICREMQIVFNDEREISIKTLSFCKNIFKHNLPDPSKIMLRDAIISLKCCIPTAIARFHTIFNYTNLPFLDELDRSSLTSRIREILMQGFKFGFEFYKEMSDTVPTDSRKKLVGSMIQFANLWMKFVIERCEKGRGMRPRWAYQGLEFLLNVCEPRNTKYLTDEEFEELKKKMDICISHVIGTTTPSSTPDSGFHSTSPRISLEYIRTRSPTTRPSNRNQKSKNYQKINNEHNSLINTDNVDTFFINSKDIDEKCPIKIKLPNHYHSSRYIDAIENLNRNLDEKLKNQDLIGQVVTPNNNDGKVLIRKKFVTFTWQRGIKIGQGRFGKVYTAVNNNNGEMMAVKEISLQQNDPITIKRVAEELKILEGISHKYLIKYYGVEVHKNEMLIFMEFCAEGTLEHLIASNENGLPELLVRRYTYQLLCGLSALHNHGIVHRDIKPANIFLTDGGNCLKIGDFGCAVKIKSHTTMPGELQSFVGTQAYMAPEVFTKNMSEGHGRAADIWSVGCVVVEMASGKRPWAQFDSNYQIMFKVGMGESPDPPDNMIDEGLDFLELCFQHDPKERATIYVLLDHNFVNVGDDYI